MERELVRFDWAIKKLLRSKANFGVLEGFLSVVLRQNLKIVNIIESESNKEDKDDKYNRVDIMVENEDKELIIVEIQVDNEFDFLSRILFGVSKSITEYMRESDPYSSVKKIYSISVVFFDLGHGLDYVYHGTTKFKGLHFDDELELNARQQELYSKDFVYQIYPEYYLIKVNRFNDIAKDSLDEWIYFLKNEEIKEEFSAKGLSEAREKLNKMKLPKEDLLDYKRYIENMHYQASMHESTYVVGKKDGIEEGKKSGIEEGKKLGIEEGKKFGIEEGGEEKTNGI